MSSILLIAEAGKVSWQITVLFSILLIGLIVTLALEEKIHAKKSIIAGSFAIICLLLGTFTGLLSFEQVVVGSHRVVAPGGEVDVEFSAPVDIEFYPDGKTEKTAEIALVDENGDGADQHEGAATEPHYSLHVVMHDA